MDLISSACPAVISLYSPHLSSFTSIVLRPLQLAAALIKSCSLPTSPQQLMHAAAYACSLTTHFIALRRCICRPTAPCPVHEYIYIPKSTSVCPWLLRGAI